MTTTTTTVTTTPKTMNTDVAFALDEREFSELLEDENVVVEVSENDVDLVGASVAETLRRGKRSPEDVDRCRRWFSRLKRIKEIEREEEEAISLGSSSSSDEEEDEAEEDDDDDDDTSSSSSDEEEDD